MPDASLVASLAERVAGSPARCGSSRVVLLDGRSGSGKSHLADRLADALRTDGREVAVLHLDQIYPGWGGLRTGVDSVLTSLLPDLCAGREAALTTWDWHAGAPGPELHVSPAADVLLIEGVGSSLARRHASLTVWLEVPEVLRRARAEARDGADTREHWEMWRDQEDSLFAESDPRVTADIVLSHEIAPQR